MSNKHTCCKILNFPTIPSYFINNLSYEQVNVNSSSYKPYYWSDENTPIYGKTPIIDPLLKKWLDENISKDVFFSFQLVSGYEGVLDIHKDKGTKQKLYYLIESGGTSVMTNFYNDDKELLKSIRMECHKWYILDVTQYHEVVGIESGKTRVGITGKLFSD